MFKNVVWLGIKNTDRSPDQFGSLVGASACLPKGHRFDSWSKAHTSVTGSPALVCACRRQPVFPSLLLNERTLLCSGPRLALNLPALVLPYTWAVGAPGRRVATGDRRWGAGVSGAQAVTRHQDAAGLEGEWVGVCSCCLSVTLCPGHGAQASAPLP